MSIVLCLSSQVARGYVGGSATRIALERMGHECWLLPTVILSNHPGHGRFAGEQVPVGRLTAMLEALEANGWLGDIDAILLGYMPSPEHVHFAVTALEKVRAAHADVLCLCDPIMGDDPDGLYIDEDTAAAIRDRLVPMANILTPNRFELEWLTGTHVVRADTAREAAKTLKPETVLATSLSGSDPQSLANMALNANGLHMTTVEKRKNAPHGAGDLFAALALGHRLKGKSLGETLAFTTASVEEALEESKASDELLLHGSDSWSNAEPWPLDDPKK